MGCDGWWLCFVSVGRGPGASCCPQPLNPPTNQPTLQFVEKDPRLAEGVIRSLLRFWPLTNSHKEVLYLGELEEVLELTQVSAWVGKSMQSIGLLVEGSRMRGALRGAEADARWWCGPALAASLS